MQTVEQQIQLPIPGAHMVVTTDREFAVVMHPQTPGLVDYFDENGSVAVWDKGGLKVQLKTSKEASPLEAKYENRMPYKVAEPMETYMKDVATRMGY